MCPSLDPIPPYPTTSHNELYPRNILIHSTNLQIVPRWPSRRQTMDSIGSPSRASHTPPYQHTQTLSPCCYPYVAATSSTPSRPPWRTNHASSSSLLASTEPTPMLSLISLWHVELAATSESSSRNSAMPQQVGSHHHWYLEPNWWTPVETSYHAPEDYGDQFVTSSAGN